MTSPDTLPQERTESVLETIDEFRADYGVTDAFVASGAGLAASTISRWRRGIRAASSDSRDKVWWFVDDYRAIMNAHARGDAQFFESYHQGAPLEKSMRAETRRAFVATLDRLTDEAHRRNAWHRRALRWLLKLARGVWK